jgi:Holliday junction resolvase-like predicted endonuclease
LQVKPLSNIKGETEIMSALKESRNQIRIFGASESLINDFELRIAMELLKSGEESLEIAWVSKKLGIDEALFLELVERVWETAGIKGNRLGTRILLPAGGDRLKLAVAAVTLGATVEESARMLSWKEFEAFCARVLEENGYSCTQEFRFKSIQRKRFECDILASRKPLVVMVDCKHYAGRVSGLRAVIKKQMERVSALSKSIPTMIRSIPEIIDWPDALVVPIIITLFQQNPSIVNDVPVVPGFKLNQFIQELPSNTDRITRALVHPMTQERLPKHVLKENPRR